MSTNAGGISESESTDEPAVIAMTDGHVTVLTLNRPQSRNAFNRAMRAQVKAHLWRADKDDDVRVVVITGAGSSFSSGVDLPEALQGVSPRAEGANPSQVLRAFSKPVIAAVNGPCYTGGLEVAMSCSFIIASDRSTFADTHTQIGLLSGWGASAVLPRAIGVPAALQMIFTGQPVHAADALRMGLVNEVVTHDTLLTRTMDVARAIAGAHPGATQRMLRLVKEGAGASLAHALGLEADAGATFKRNGADLSARFDRLRSNRTD